MLPVAAASAAAYGTYRGGKAAMAATKKKLTRRKDVKDRDKEREDEIQARAARISNEKTEAATMTFEQRMAKVKRELGHDDRKKAGSKISLGRLTKGSKK
mmetsp:Transcript_33028/g.46894  ORF Transcript_33028/g.46894 Transcript_33028/m.46894 type:complete len:100 (+) Transcript_33028:37-336(+)|eukprot:CAMPEP_0202451132 /NCGR_PEP_ID=MMETSP1360-20130828/9630_1 /ASSEMBLY_ACC=CAM_ASM_000848 /TAXON_ID=515479 /ORGANISM="Licmophora paradoxa, Strain CCMP2313" /LENGTH=99 /DNA_ID=CAMNT_0049069623 /DNA_START=37 /DNA_END=336 /DNA_ORIENTATION=-